MKQARAFLLAVILSAVFVLESAVVFPQTASATQGQPPLLFVFDSEASISNLAGGNTNAEKTYDAAEKAVKLTIRTIPAANDGNAVRFSVAWPTMTDSCSRYPVLALRLKLSDSQMTGRVNNIISTPSVSAANQSGQLFARTTEWQTVVVDMSGMFPNEFWKSLLCKLLDHTTLRTGESIEIRWVGMFESADAAASFATAEDTPPLLYQFNSQAAIDKLNVSGGTFTKRLDPDEKAMKLTLTSAASGVDTFRIQIGWDGDTPAYPPLDKLHVPTDAYPFFAARIRLSSRDIRSHTWGAYGWDGQNYFGDRNYPTGGAVPEYEATTEWQTIVMDMGMFPALDHQYWKEILIKLADTVTIHVGDSISIQWMGFFRSRKDVCNFMGTEYPDPITKVACVGDSITYGAYSSSVFSRSYPAQLQKLLGDSYEVANFGVSGTRMINGVSNSYTATDRYMDSLSYQPDIVVLCLGTNDLNALSANNSLLQDYGRDAKALIASYRALPTQPKIYLATTPWFDPSAAAGKITAGAQNLLKNSLVPLQTGLAGDNGCALVNIYAATEGKSALLTDGIHFTDDGYLYLAQRFYNSLSARGSGESSSLSSGSAGSVPGMPGGETSSQVAAANAATGDGFGVRAVMAGGLVSGILACAFRRRRNKKAGPALPGESSAPMP